MEEQYIPKGLDNYFAFGNFYDVVKIIESEDFLPTFLTGLSRSGKTCMVEQACHVTGRELIRVNITEQTDEDDLIGGFRLTDGNTVWSDGPVIVAMKRGAVLLLDEVDLGSFRCMCLQPILEGSPIFIKKIGELVEPSDGFNIFATANTKGQGDNRGKFVGTNILNEAFLDRFSITFEHDYPPQDVELDIISSYIPDGGIVKDADEIFITSLVQWASKIRENYRDGDISDIISTGRLIHIMKAYRVFKDPIIAVEFCISRFDKNNKDVFMDHFKKIFPYDSDDFTNLSAKERNTKMFKAQSSDLELPAIPKVKKYGN